MFVVTENNGELLQGPSGKRNRGYTVKTKSHHYFKSYCTSVTPPLHLALEIIRMAFLVAISVIFKNLQGAL